MHMTTANNTAGRLKVLAQQICGCVKCPLHASRTLAVAGDGTPAARIMIIGEAPGRDEDESGHAFVGAAGRFLNQVLDGTGFVRADLFITNIVKCRPPQNRTPRALEVEICTSNYLFEQIKLINPVLIVLLGSIAASAVIDEPNLKDIHGRILERDGRKYFATYHPAARSQRSDLAAVIDQDFAQLKRELKKLQD